MLLFLIMLHRSGIRDSVIFRLPHAGAPLTITLLGSFPSGICLSCHSAIRPHGAGRASIAEIAAMPRPSITGLAKALRK
jgi:hypothetical protein